MSLIRKNDFQKERTNIIFQKLMSMPSSVTTIFQKRGPNENYSEFDMSHKQAQNLIDTMDVFVLGSLCTFLAKNYDNLENTGYLPENLMEIGTFIVDNNILPPLVALGVRLGANYISQKETLHDYISNLNGNKVIEDKYNIKNFKSFNLAYSISYILNTFDSIPNAPTLKDTADKLPVIKEWLLDIKTKVNSFLDETFTRKTYNNLKIELFFFPQTAIEMSKNFVNQIIKKNLFNTKFNSKNEFLKSKEKVEKFITKNKDVYIEESSLNRKNFDHVKRDLMKTVDEIYRVSYEKFIEQNIKMSFAYELSQYIKHGKAKNPKIFKNFAQLPEKAHHSYDDNNKFKPYEAISNISSQILVAIKNNSPHALYYKIPREYNQKKLKSKNSNRLLDDKTAFDLTINYLEQQNILRLHTFNEILDKQLEHQHKIIRKRRTLLKAINKKF